MVDGHAQHQQRVSLAELLEVRDGGLTASEVLTVLASSCDNLVRLSNRRGLFTTEQIFITRESRIEVFYLFKKSEKLLDSIDSNCRNTKAVNSTRTAWSTAAIWSKRGWRAFGLVPWLVLRTGFYLKIKRKIKTKASAADHSDVALHSLLNLMTVSHVQSRPTLPKVKQMVRNRMDIVEVERQPQVIAGLFREVMGDLDELAADPFGDDIRFSSSRSSQLSIVPGPGAPEFQRGFLLLGGKKRKMRRKARPGVGSISTRISIRGCRQIAQGFFTFQKAFAKRRRWKCANGIWRSK